MSVKGTNISAISLPPALIRVVHFRAPATKDTLEMVLSATLIMQVSKIFVTLLHC